MAEPRNCTILGVPVQEGLSQAGCVMGPDAYRTAGLIAALCDLGHDVEDRGNLQRPQPLAVAHPNAALKNLGTVAAWTCVLRPAVRDICASGRFPVVLGGDHCMAMGVLTGLTDHAAAVGRPQFLLWLDAHTDIHTLQTTTSGHLHGVPIAYLLGEPGFAPAFPDDIEHLPAENICMLGIRSVDPAERDILKRHAIEVHDMRALDERGVVAPVIAFLERVKAADGLLHVSLDVDFLDPSIAPGVNTVVPGGATFREGHLIMELVHDSGLATSLDLVELNPFLDERGRTAKLMADLAASLLGRTVLDRTSAPY